MSSKEIITHLENLMEIEASSRDVYREVLEGVSDERVMSLMRWLIREEARHKEMLEDALGLLRRD